MRKMSYLMFAGTLALASCSNPKTASNSNFQTAIQKYLDTQPACTYVSLNGHPLPQDVDLRTADWSKQGVDPLISAGLVKESDATIKEQQWDGTSKSAPGKHFELTEKGKQFVSKGYADRTTLCYGKPVITKIVRYTEPSDAMGMKMSQVTYTWHLEDVADWAKNDVIQKASPDIASNLASEQKAEATVVLTNEGWLDSRMMDK